MDLTSIIIIIAVLLLPRWIYWHSSLKRRRMLEVITKIPGPLSLPFIGTTYYALWGKKEDFFQIIDRVTKEHWPLFRVWMGPMPEVHFIEADHIETILRSSLNVNKGFLYDFIHPWLGTGLLTSKGEKWHKHRKLLTPSFHFKILENFQDVFTEKAQILVEKMGKEVGNKEGFDVCPYITRCTLDIICETSMGTPINAQEDTHSPYVTAIHQIADIFMKRIFSPWLHPDFVYYLTTEGKRMKDTLHTLHSFSRDVIRKRKQLLKNNTETQEEAHVFGKKKRMAFLDILLEVAKDGAILTDEEIREQVDTFMFAGHDTTAASLSWTIFLLGNYPDIQERVFEEQAAIFGDSGRLPNMQDLAGMKYLEQVIKESLRLYPSVPFITRSVTEDIEVGGYSVTEGCEVVIHIYHAHRNPKYFPDPDTFNPDNFLPEKVQGRHPYAYVPFSAGSRNCIGQKFALQEEKTVLSAVVRHFRIRALDSPSQVKLTGEFILRSFNGIRLTLERR